MIRNFATVVAACALLACAPRRADVVGEYYGSKGETTERLYLLANGSSQQVLKWRDHQNQTSGSWELRSTALEVRQYVLSPDTGARANDCELFSSVTYGVHGDRLTREGVRGSNDEYFVHELRKQ